MRAANDKQAQKKIPAEAGNFLFEKTGCLLDLLRSSARSTHNSRLFTSNSCSNFFATPTRLADGLGTKDYPFITPDDSPPQGRSLTFGSPVPVRQRTGFGDQLFNNKK